MAKSKIQQARVLGGFTLDGVDYNPNDIIEADAGMIKALGSSVDSGKDAVDYCLSLKNPVIKRYESKAKPEPEPEPEPAPEAQSGPSVE